ncbi:MAG TPA: hypothetical protein VK211_15970 [Kamptonema sp.]|nr:hypothetical protein [Kamptonema sp.]
MITPEFTTTEMMVGDKVEGTISKFGERDTYTFTGEIGQQVIFDSLTGKPSLGVKIYSPSGLEVYNRGTTEEQPPFTLLEAGTYRVEIDGNNRENGDYSFRLLNLASTNHPNVSNLRFDTNIEPI